MSVTVRFAPSPTGRLHVGNIRTALVNYLFAKAQGGQFVLRIDDTDLERSRAEYETGIETDLAWLGLNWDRKENQSKRFEAYHAAAETLKAKGLLYPCYETEDELERRRKILMSRGKPPVYDRAALKLTDEDRAKLEAEGRTPHWRFKLSGGRADWHDLVRGDSSIDTSSASDPVLIRADGLFLYTLPSVVDDIDFKITHIVRGEDHVTNGGVQIEIFRALGSEPPAMAHFPLLVGADGSALSKRLGSLSVLELRETGFEPMAILSQLAKIGTSDPVEMRSELASLIGEFSFDKIGRAPARFDPADIERLNAALLHATDYATAKPRLAALDCDLGEGFWLAVRGNIVKYTDVVAWADIVRKPLAPVIEDQAFLDQALEVLPPAPFDDTSWKTFTDAIKAKTGAKGKALFMPLRLALTGLPHGPEMALIFPLMSEDRIRARLSGAEA